MRKLENSHLYQIDGIITSLCLSVFVLFQDFTPAHADEANSQTAYLTIPARPNTRVYDNALLDKLFDNDRAAKQEDNKNQEKNESASAPGTESQSIQPNQSLTARVTPRTHPKRAAALRLAEKGRKHLQGGEYEKALVRFERAIAIDANSYHPYIHYYLARTHYYLANYRESSNFLEVAEPWLKEKPYWMAEVAALKEENVRAVRKASHAQASYRVGIKKINIARGPSGTSTRTY